MLVIVPFTAKASEFALHRKRPAVLNMLLIMAHAQVFTLFALIQYCSAEIASNSPGAGSWFAANVISDSDFSPKPLTEIFTTERAFLSTNPIVVLPPSSQSPVVDTTTTPETSGTPETSSQSTVSIPPSSDNPAPISTSTITTTFGSSTVTQTAMQIDTVAPAQTGPPAISDAPPQNLAQPNQNFFYIYPGSQIAGVPLPQGQFQTAPQPQGQFQTAPQPQLQTAATTVAPCVTATSAPQTTTVSPASSTIGSAPVTSTQNTTNGFPTIRIRMLSPAGSVTNINFVRGSSSTVRPRTTTRRNRRRNRNNYDDCIDTCVGRRTPICASPVGRPNISADTLKGFPTMCHMACNNAFRRNAYEKVADGRCGRLRRRIMNMNQPSRNQFTILANPGSFVEFQPAVITSNNL